MDAALGDLRLRVPGFQLHVHQGIAGDSLVRKSRVAQVVEGPERLGDPGTYERRPNRRNSRRGSPQAVNMLALAHLNERGEIGECHSRAGLVVDGGHATGDPLVHEKHIGAAVDIGKRCGDRHLAA
jgi:hypothetical protein